MFPSHDQRYIYNVTVVRDELSVEQFFVPEFIEASTPQQGEIYLTDQLADIQAAILGDYEEARIRLASTYGPIVVNSFDVGTVLRSHFEPRPYDDIWPVVVDVSVQQYFKPYIIDGVHLRISSGLSPYFVTTREVKDAFIESSSPVTQVYLPRRIHGKCKFLVDTAGGAFRLPTGGNNFVEIFGSCSLEVSGTGVYRVDAASTYNFAVYGE